MENKKVKSFFKIYFNEYLGKKDYSIEIENVPSYWEYIPLLTQGYVRCLNNIGINNKETAEMLRYIVRRILLISYKNIDDIKDQYDSNKSFNIIDYLINEDRDWSSGSILHVLSEFQEDGEVYNSPVNVKYKIEITNQGQIIMYNVSLRITEQLQLYSYLIMLKYILPLFTDFETFLFFLHYMIQIDKNLDKYNYSSTRGMRKIIKNASREILKFIENRELDDTYRLCAPKL